MLLILRRRLLTSFVFRTPPVIYTRYASSIPKSTVQQPCSEPARRYGSEDSPPSPPPDDPKDNARSNHGASVKESNEVSEKPVKRRGRPARSKALIKEEKEADVGPRIPAWFLDRNVQRYAEVNASTFSTVGLGASKEYENIPEYLWQEIVSHTRAAFMLPQGPSLNSLAAKKSHILIQCTHEGMTYFLQDLVGKVAKEIGANLIKIDAQDLEELTGDLNSTTGKEFGVDASSLRSFGYPLLSSPEQIARDEEDLENEDDDDGPDLEQESMRPTSTFRHPPHHLFQIVASALESPGRPNINLAHLPLLAKSSSDPQDTLMAYLARILDGPKLKESLVTPSRESVSSHPTILYLADIIPLSHSPYGSNIHFAIQDIIREKRNLGEKVVIIGGSALQNIVSLSSEHIDRHYHIIRIPPSTSPEMQKSFAEDHSRHVQTINIRHLHDQIKRKLGAGIPITQFPLLLNSTVGSELDSCKDLSESVWPFYRINRLASVVVGGIAQRNPINGTITQQDIMKAISLIEKVEEFKRKSDLDTKERARKDGALKQIPFDDCNRYEQKLLGGVVDPDKIQVGFSSVRAPEVTVKALKTLISLPLTHPEAFSRGILAKNRISGVLLFGPPGSGKTMLAKAIAKESGARVLEVKGSEVFEMYVGEGEKNVKAIFSLARKLAPCVIFLDEVDAIFNSRRSDYNNIPSHREIINQFMAEWDGLTSQTKGVLLMGATNRPFDIDDAIIRRMPRRILVDLPTEEDRKEILRIHLEDETLDSDVDLADIAKRTNLFSGSDIKNLCVAAALAAITESQSPLERILKKSHVETALSEIAPSISDDMSTLAELRKWDERYGDGTGKKGRRGRRVIGFASGLHNSDTRIRQDSGV